MQMARVIGDVVATMKDAQLSGHRLLVVQPILADRQPVGRPVVALDCVSAGVGEIVFFVRGREASFPFLPAEPPTDACVVGIVDAWESGAEGSEVSTSQGAKVERARAQ